MSNDKDHPLWRKVTESVTPLKGRDVIQHDTPKAPRGSREAIMRIDRDPVDTPPMVSDKASAPAPIDPKIKRKLVKGATSFDRTLDLHGMTQAAAFRVLERAILEGVSAGQRTLLVITGKGGKRFSQLDSNAPVGARKRADFAMHQGILRQAVRDWIAAPPLSRFVAGYSEADQKHGGAGALYIRLRRMRDRF